MPAPAGDGSFLPRVERVLREIRAELGVELPAEPTFSADAKPVQELSRFLDLVVSWNARMDLTAARNADELIDLFVADAAVLASVSEHTGRKAKTWLDVGSGAGAPGLPLALLRPDLQMCLVEPKQKRVAFLRTAIGALGCKHVRAERTRSDALGAHSFDVVVSRATLPPAEWLKEGARLAREAVWVLLAKAEAPALFGWRLQHELNYRWPLSRSERRALCYVPDLSRRGDS